MDYTQKDSFFDDSEETSFWTQTQFPAQEIKTELIDSMLIHKERELVKRKVGMMSHYLLLFKEQEVHKWVNLINATMELIKNPAAGQGIRFLKNKQRFEMYGDVEPWYNYLKKYCIQRCFSQRYSLLKKIGQGNFAEVFKAVSKADGQEYAIKCFRKQDLKEEVDKLSIIKETSIMRKLQHESVIKMYEVFEGEEYLYLVLEYLNGGELHKFMKKSPPFSEEKCSKLIYKLLKACLFIHEQGILHRDIKPENIMLRKKDDLEDLCICDFGLADYYNPNGKYLFTRCGTPGYVAPELLQDKLYDYKVDVYSIGILMFILIAGKSPFEGKDYDDVVMRNYYAKVKFEECKLSEHGMSLLQGLMNKNPVKRLSALEALNHQWFVQEKLAKTCQFKIRRHSNIKRLPHLNGSPIPTTNFLSPKNSFNNLSPQSLTRTDDNTPNSPITPVTPLQNKGKPIRKSIFKLQQL
ncbi:unnamed protein product (macronuclear) [Paramecium tetraurelia]|uniref:non-specific serine/threonine protein kinase n=1 Tax=Paramecium tetraurelia TaxID=5888 RepID=A0D3T3_PARTE|nr:uncharacterized protein GSPATT00013165001 [Paramecium tetraurelia]CAK77700.1 unnamed protein product [Paramecium tetraurelia]|eukprot:XP_001445097.1 hypothetical protein (macronuclear) [Paramecium tetraurelia strain d4-2]